VSPVPRPPEAFRLVGRSTGRIDARDIVTGRAQYALDLDLGAKPAVVARPPTIKGTVARVDDRAARSMPGVLAIATVPTGVAVVAENFDVALKARDALNISWKPGPFAGISDAGVFEQLHAAAPPFLAPPVRGPGNAAQTVERAFDYAFISHAPLETMTAVADVRPDGAEVWCACQSPIHAQSEVAKAVGLPAESVTLHVARSGGSFGRRLHPDAAVEAATISKATRLPVKLLTTRADDMRHGRVRPASHHRIRATVLRGSVVAYEHRAATTSMDLGHGFGDVLTATLTSTLPSGRGSTLFRTLAGTPYEFGVENFVLDEIDLKVPSGSWRSVYSGTAAVSDEIMTDQIALAIGEDPVAFRLARLTDERIRSVLRKVRDAGRWGRSLPVGHGQGLAVHREHKSTVAYLVEIDATVRSAPRVTKVVIAADVGRCINPSGLEAQLIGCTMDGISATLYAGNHLENGALRESSYDDFRWARMRHSPPQIEVHILPTTTGVPGGAGELGYPAAAAAVANAYARATATLPQRFPIVG
jgi:isoquinoline 1-oxidoreductase beta subunit